MVNLLDITWKNWLIAVWTFIFYNRIRTFHYELTKNNEWSNVDRNIVLSQITLKTWLIRWVNWKDNKNP